MEKQKIDSGSRPLPASSGAILQTLRREIITGRLRPGSVFDEKAFAAAQGVSRTPVREAVLKLAQENLLLVMPRKGTLVTSISMDDIRQVYEMRGMIEPQIAGIAARKGNREQFEGWKQYYEQKYQEAIEPGFDFARMTLEFPDDDSGFHQMLAACTGNRYLIRQMEELMNHSQRIRYLSSEVSKDRYAASLKEHLEILDALLSGQSDQAQDAMKRHLYHTQEGYGTWIWQ